MRVRINGVDLLIEPLMTVALLIARRKMQPEMVVVEYNGVILDKDKWEAAVFKENDVLEILSFMGGG
ncbi:MAG: sulfur carrier protein ThiS [Candidatus Omnitrophota bacterium]